MRHRLPTLALAVAAFLSASVAAADARPLGAGRAPVVWATVNVCDTAAQPDRMGIRGGMPGLARKTRMVMRFRVQYRDVNGRWRLTRSGADSGWQRVATARGGRYDAGWTFTFKPPTSGGAHVLRGVVTFQWRRGGRVIQRARTVTAAGHPGTAGADPADFSAATCEIA